MKKYVQQIMLGTVTGNEKQARATLERIKNAGYDGLELNRFMIHPSSFMVRTLTRMAGMPTGRGGNLNWQNLIKESGLSVASLHTDLGSLKREPEKVAQDAASFNTDRLVITGMYRFDYSSPDEVKKLAASLNEAGKLLKERNMSLLYHNHNVELLKVAENKTAYDVLLEETDGDFVGFEFDSYWFTEAGADAVSWMKRLGQRMKMWHVTDRGSRQSGVSMTPILKADSMELGYGNMNLDALSNIALINGVNSVVLESHKNWIDNDPLKSIETSAKWFEGRF
ncbi:MAG: sugar phosphate isomerase/epimerase [Sphaerochaetaceae bacterium]|nr:sugar phosphate isomerase/epimerase [Sphaerochaetaceae bacterium]